MLPIPTPFYLDAMDPGGTTGLSLLLVTEETFTVEEQKAVRYRPGNGVSPIRVLKEWHHQYDEHPHIMVYENFHIRPGQNSTDITAFGLITALEHWVMDDNPYSGMFPQEPAMGKTLVPDKILERLDLKAYGAGARHICDANRHAAAYLASHSYQPLCELGWPRPPRKAASDHPSSSPAPGACRTPMQA